MGQPSDFNRKMMREMWGTTHLITNYDSNHLLQEVMHDEMLKKTKKFDSTNELHEKIRNDEDYDDWEYGTEPTYGRQVL
jgi:hypothetical protein